MVDEFLNLPEPEVITEDDYDTINTRNVTALKASNPDFEGLIDSDPAIKVTQNISAGEQFVLKSLNTGFKRTFVQFATGSDLDLLASDEALTRLVITAADDTVFPPIEEVLETDTALRRRIFLAKQARRSNNAAHYALQALSVTGVEDVYVVSEVAGEVSVYILSSEGNGVPDAALLTAVTDQIYNTTEDVRANTITVNVLAITLVNVDVYANIYLTEDAPIDVFNDLEASYTTKFNTNRAIGLDFPVSTSYKYLMQDGVHRIELFSDAGKTTPLADITIANNEIINLNTLDLTFSGRER